MSWALMKHPEGLAVHFFVSHCWSESFFEFCGKVRESWPPAARHLWCCVFANPQAWPSAALKALLGADPFLSPFARALARAQEVLVVPTAACSIYERGWCVPE